MRRALLVLALPLLLTTTADAQSPPSEARIRADLIEHAFPGATSVEIRGDGTREWTGTVHEYYRSVTARRPYSEMPGVEIEAYGDIVYQSHGSSYAYSDYRVGDWRYFGIPDPSAEEVAAIIETDAPEFYPHRTLDADRSLTVLDEETYWHNPTSVTVKVGAQYKTLVSNTEISESEGVFDVRLYRETYEGPWTRFIILGRDETEVGRETLPSHEVAEMRTLKDAAAIAGLEAEASALPDVSVPAFSSGRELADYTYRMLRESDRATFEAYLRAVLAPRHFVEGSEAALGVRAKMEMVDPLLAQAFDGQLTFAEVACETPILHEERTRRSASRVYYHSALTAPPRGSGSGIALEVAFEEAPGGYRNGQQLPGRFAIGTIKAYVSSDADDVAWVRSFDDPSAMCPGTVGRAAQETTEGARDAVEGAVQEGRRRLGRIFGRGN
ncbi:MAG: hypothetical protein Rubg2KO_12320 [Rubricoccaceae bacterium]